MSFYLTFGFLVFKVVNKGTMNLNEGSEDFGFSNFIWLDSKEKQKKLSSLTRDCSLPIFPTNETITNLTQHELSQEESDLPKAGLYFLIQPDKIRKSEIFTTFEKIHCSLFPYIL